MVNSSHAVMSPPYPLSPTSTSSHVFNGNSRPLSSMSGYSPKPSSTNPSSNNSSSNNSSSNNPSSNNPSLPRPYAHISDLQANAVKGVDVNHSLKYLITEAQRALTSADTLLGYRRPDLAYQDYLRAFEIVVNVIPRHAELPGKGGPMQSTHRDLVQRISKSTTRYESIKEIITNDNRRNNTQPASATNSTRQSDLPRDHFHRSTQSVGTATYSNQSVGTATYPNQSTSIQHRASTFIPPPVAPSAASGAEALNDRFTRLRMGSGTPDSRVSTFSNGSDSSLHSYSPRASVDISSLPPSLRPNGPRSIHPLDTSFAAAMPKPPDAVYSPARNMQISGNINPPRSSARSIVGTGGRSNSAMSSASSYAPGNEGNDEAGYFPTAASTETLPTTLPRRKSVHVPKEMRIGAEKLYDYLKIYSILLIDVRSREDFDDGHIYAPCIINIDPTTLRRDMSADDLHDTLVLSPEHEQSAFSDRNKFDLVVYYDQATASDRFLNCPSTEREWTLRHLYDALYNYSQDKPLQRPPILLEGGIEAWTELVGDQALARSNTASRARSSRPTRKVPVASNFSRLHVQKKRREYNPLDADEERKWLERARVESIAVDQKPPLDEEDESQQVEDASPFYSNIDEFNRRFPEAGRIDQRYAMDPSSQPSQQPQQSQQPRGRIPSYPTPPPRSSNMPPPLPAVPSRPLPAASRMSYSGVSDRVVSQQSTGSSDLPAYVPPRYLPSNLRLPRTGLVNFGVTCYMNATIQALSATTPLTLFFLDDRFKQFIQRENWKGSKGVLPELYSNLIRSVWKGDVEAIRPTTLRSFCARLNSEWGVDRQQDAKEFFDFLVDCLHEDLNENWSRTPLKALTDAQEEIREKMPKSVVSKTEWGRYTHRELSYLTSLFGGQHASRLRCTTCQFTSTTYEAFYSISVEIPGSGRATIDDCLRSYCAEEMLSGDEVWKCPRCQKEREATKQITITRAPQFLVVHFKRFSAGRGESARKVRTPVEFPLRNLNLQPYVLNTEKEQKHLRDLPPDQKPDSTMTPPFLYDAYAVMRHIGTTLTRGHYTCLAKDRARGCWRQFNDTWIGDFDPERLPERERLQNEMAYIVFYQRVQDK